MKYYIFSSPYHLKIKKTSIIIDCFSRIFLFGQETNYRHFRQKGSPLVFPRFQMSKYGLPFKKQGLGAEQIRMLFSFCVTSFGEICTFYISKSYYYIIVKPVCLFVCQHFKSCLIQCLMEFKV